MARKDGMVRQRPAEISNNLISLARRENLPGSPYQHVSQEAHATRATARLSASPP
jgi:hypothetical protein